jgi:hypothetical protein
MNDRGVSEEFAGNLCFRVLQKAVPHCS